METISLLEQLKQLTSGEDILAVSHDVNELKSQFQDHTLNEERRVQQAMLDARENESDLDEFETQLASLEQVKKEFYDLYNAYRDKRLELQTAQKLEQEANLRMKRSLIERLQKLISEEENIGAAIAEYKVIHESWKEVGDIPREKRQEIQGEYSKLLESFFFNLKIYRELKDHDLRRNLQLKKEVVQKIGQLEQVESLKEVEGAIKALQNEFEETGPVPRDEWEGLKNEYWELVKKTYARIHEFYESKREELKLNIEKKTALLEELVSFVQENTAINSGKEWDEKTNLLLEIQDRWKKIGFGTKKENEELWAKFRAQCDLFFDAKKQFYEQLREQFKAVADRKREIIAKAHELKESTEWKQTTDALLKLQQDWKKAGNASQRLEQALWRDFRSACDSFFNAKQKHFEEADKQFEVNLTAKMDVVSKIEAYQLPEDKKQALQDLKEFSAAFNAIGKVPFKEKDKIYQSFKQALDSHYNKLKLEGEEKDKAVFQAKLDQLKANPDAGKMLDREKRDIHQQINHLQQEINTFENNLGFFSRSKGADALKKEVEQKVAATRRKIDDLKRKLKMLHE